jgi:hypothetical protein
LKLASTKQELTDLPPLTIKRREMMKTFIGIVLIVVGLFLAAYVGIWLCFIGGIVQILEEVKSPDAINSLTIAYGVVKIVLAGTIGALCGVVGIVPGYVILTDR